ncbi:MAG: glycosyltransferase family 39 protein, partial [Pseudomonadota bacterium]
MPQLTSGTEIKPETLLTARKRFTPGFFFWSTLVVTTVIRFAYAMKLPLTGDEAYFWEWGRHPALGYYDHPPIAGWILWFTRQIFGDTVAAIRVPAVLSGTVVVAVVHRFTLSVTGSERSAALTGLLAMGIPVLSVLGVLYSTDTPILAAGTMGGYFFHKAVKYEDNRAWFWTGICFAVVLGSKFLGVPLLAAAGLYLLLNPGQRHHLKTPGPYWAAGITLLGILPVLIWNASNNWYTFTFNFASRHTSHHPGIKGFLDYIAGQALALSPLVLILAPGILASAFFLWRKDEDNGLIMAAFFALLPLAGFLMLSPLTRIGMHWPAVAVPFLTVALGARLTAGPGKWRTYAATTSAAWLTTLVLLLIPLAPFLLPADWAWPLRPDKINTAQLKKAMGSPAESGELVGRVLQVMEKDRKVFVFTRSYALSSLVAFYTPGHPEVTVLGTGS